MIQAARVRWSPSPGWRHGNTTALTSTPRRGISRDFTGFGDEKTRENQGKPGKTREKPGKMVGFHWFGMRKTRKNGGISRFSRMKNGGLKLIMGISRGKMGCFDCRRFLVVVSRIIFFGDVTNKTTMECDRYIMEILRMAGG